MAYASILLCLAILGSAFLIGLVRLPYLDGLRGFCALYIAVSHASARFIVPGNLDSLSYAFTRAVAYGHSAVTIFIVISGFSLGLQLKPDCPLQMIPFLKRRFWRIVPPVYALLLLAIGLAFIRFRLLGIDWMPDQRQLIYDLLLLNDFQGDVALVTGPLWTVALEAKIYCLSPLLVWLYRRQGAIAVFVFAVTFSAIACGINWLLVGNQNLSLWYVGLFALGFLASQKAMPQPQAIAWFAGTVLLLFCLWFPTWGYWYSPQHYQYHYWEFDLALGLLCASLFQLSIGTDKPVWLARLFAVRAFTALGLCSYSLYLVHEPVYACWQAYAIKLGYNNRPILFSAAIALALSSGWLFYWLIERHFVPHRQNVLPAPPFHQ